MTVSSGVRIRPLRPADLELLGVWLARPHVSAWWGDAEDAFGEARERAADSHAIIEAEGEPVGYLCWEVPDPDELAAAGLQDLPPRLLDLDILLGNAEAQGRGVAALAVAQLVEQLCASGAATHLGAAMSLRNQRACRAAEKMGFRLHREFHDPEAGACQYLLLELHA